MQCSNLILFFISVGNHIKFYIECHWLPGRRTSDFESIISKSIIHNSILGTRWEIIQNQMPEIH